MVNVEECKALMEAMFIDKEHGFYSSETSDWGVPTYEVQSIMGSTRLVMRDIWVHRGEVELYDHMITQKAIRAAWLLFECSREACANHHKESLAHNIRNDNGKNRNKNRRN